MKPYHLVIVVGRGAGTFDKVRVVEIDLVDPRPYARPVTVDTPDGDGGGDETPTLHDALFCDEQTPYATVPEVAAADTAEGSDVETADTHVSGTDVEPGDVTHPLLGPLLASGLNAADFRSRVLVCFGDDLDPLAAVFTLALLNLFAGRRLDVMANGEILVAGTEPPSDAPKANTGDLYRVEVDADLNDQDVRDAVRSHRKAAVDVSDLHSTVRRWVAVADLRVRGDNDRLPSLTVDELWVDVEGLRSDVTALRRMQRNDVSLPVVEPGEIAERVKDLLVASMLDAGDVLTQLGSSSPDGVLWHCPRPDRHSNGDINASMKVDGNRVRCFRCDQEKIDVVRLVADVNRCSFDEAAAWLLTTTSM